MHNFQTSARGWLLAPLAVGLALGRRWSFHRVAFVAGETHHVVVVEALADGAAVDGTAGVAARDGCPGERWQRDVARKSGPGRDGKERGNKFNMCDQ